jgi:altronate dehydratase small subunit
MAKLKAIVMKEKDNVCTVVEEVVAGTDVGMDVGGKVLVINAGDSIQMGHKLATREIAQGDIVVKYGEIIGRATQNIAVGRHVHVHNMESCRGRGDK